MNFSRFSAFSAITGPAERKNSLQMRRFQTISEFSHGLGRQRLPAMRERFYSDPQIGQSKNTALKIVTRNRTRFSRELRA
jgi:hypothetical protein